MEEEGRLTALGGGKGGGKLLERPAMASEGAPDMWPIPPRACPSVAPSAFDPRPQSFVTADTPPPNGGPTTGRLAMPLLARELGPA
jgi:hypothetical protein